MNDHDEDEDERGFFARHKFWVILAVLALAGGGVYWKMNQPEKPAVAAEKERILTVAVPTPIPVRPKPTPPPQPEQPKLAQKPKMDDAPKPDAKPEPPKAAPQPQQSMGSNIKGTGNDGFGLSGSGNGGFVGLGGNGATGGNGYGRYASQVKSRVVEALRQDKRTRTAAFDVKVKIWIDDTGRVTRAEPAGSDAAATLVGIRFAEAPPQGMPMPLTASVSARRP